MGLVVKVKQALGWMEPDIPEEDVLDVEHPDEIPPKELNKRVNSLLPEGDPREEEA